MGIKEASSMPDYKITRVYGIDNVSDLATNRLRKDGAYFYEIENVDIDDMGKPHLRDGFGSAIVSGTNIRSLWANDDICLYLQGTTFKRLNADNTSTILIEDVSGDDDFAYTFNGNYVYFSNMSIIGYIDVRTGLPYPFPTPTEDYKVRMVGGQILEWYNSRLYAANNTNLFFSDATIPTRMDTRKNAISFKSRITMVKAVDNGIYVSDSEKVYFEAGRSPISEWVETPKLDYPAIEGMSAVLVPKGAPAARVAYWLAEDGYVYAGYNQGVVVKVQEGLFQKTGLTSGSAIIRNSPFQQFLAIGR
jgi:hypothetical protein